MAHHFDDFGHHVEWIFSASGHGKSVVDGIGGCLKQRAAEESMKKGMQDKIKDANSFSAFMIRKGYQTIPILITKEEIDTTALDLDERWKSAQTVKGTQKFHHYEVDKEDPNFIRVKYFSSSNESQKIRIMKKNYQRNS